jgi:hypothetical protein
MVEEEYKKLKEYRDSLFLKANPEYRMVPATLLEFINEKEFLNSEEDTYQMLKEIGSVVCGGANNRQFNLSKYNESVFVGGIGSGKSFLSQILLCYIAHWLLCLKDAHEYYRLERDKPIVLVNMGLSATQAKNVVFTGIRQMIGNSNWFKQFNNEILTTEIKLDVDEYSGVPRIHLICGNSRETMPIGMNVFAGILDEAAFYLDNEGRQVAEDIYNAMRRRMVSRYRGEGLIMMISSPLYPEDFIMKKYDESKERDYIYGTQKATWEVTDKDRYDGRTFDFVVSKDPETGHPEETIKGIPKVFEDDFIRNPEKALRDFAARPTAAINAFFKDFSMVLKCINPKREPPIDEKGRFKNWFKPKDQHTQYFIHVDLALGKEGGDSAGIGMCHVERIDKVKNELGAFENRPLIKVDYVEKMRAEPGKELEFSDIRQKIIDIKNRGFRLGKVTYDGWNSVDSLQILKSKGIKTELLSVDRTLEPYYSLKAAILEERLDMYSYNALTEELKRLEEIKGKKVDHAVNSSKDVSDGLCGAVFNASQEKVEGGFIMAG